MNPSFEQTLVDVWRQVLVEHANVVELGGKRYSVSVTPRKGLRQVDFVFDGNEIRGVEQNPDTKSRWAQMARPGKKVMQFLSERRYIANVPPHVGNLRRGITHEEMKNMNNLLYCFVLRQVQSCS